ncbi:hypothetical protein CVCC1112_2907 [Paenarthrobacter nicotinovorans]|nr:hypothetical protein CVCC1112_2907 [Paenarthrobacter nicotinovorans]
MAATKTANTAGTVIRIECIIVPIELSNCSKHSMEHFKLVPSTVEDP